MNRMKSYKMLYKNYYRFGQTLIDKVVVISGAFKFSFDFEGEEYLHELVTQKKGGLLLSAHVGNWEAAAQLLQRLNTKINVVMYDGENKQVKDYLSNVTGKKSFTVIYVKNDFSHIYKINEALASNELVCMHADRYLPGNRTITTNFLGAVARFPEGPFLLALKLKVPVVFVNSFKQTATHYRLYSTKIKYFYSSEGDSMQSILTDFAENLEKGIKHYPEQWFNYYDFWQK